MIEVNRHTLANGLRIVHSEDASTQMVALNILYDVGARDEHPQHTGFAHLFEHLMFGGSKHIPNYDRPLQTAGGENNAWTNNDVTNYYLTLPAQNVETGFWLESDRMLELAFTPQSLEVQRQVVSEEFKQRYLNQPYGDLAFLVRELAYRVHPYRWPTIGLSIEHIAQATLDEVRSFFFRHYAPNNAILAITGNITAERAFRLSEKWFGGIPRRDVPPRDLPEEPRQTEERRLTVERNVPAPLLYMAFHMPGRCHPAYHAFDLLSDLLANGRSSRLIQHLQKDRHIFASIDAYVSGTIDPGLLHISGRLAPGISMAQAEDSLWRELETLKQEEPGKEELEKVKNKFESNQLFANLNYLDLAANLAFFELIGKAEDINGEVAKCRAVTPGDIRRTAQAAFTHENCCVVHYLAKP